MENTHGKREGGRESVYVCVYERYGERGKNERNVKERMKNMLDIDERHCAHSFSLYKLLCELQLSDVPKNDDFP